MGELDGVQGVDAGRGFIVKALRPEVEAFERAATHARERLIDAATRARLAYEAQWSEIPKGKGCYCTFRDARKIAMDARRLAVDLAEAARDDAMAEAAAVYLRSVEQPR